MITDKSVTMKRLNYVLPEWTRIIWSSEAIRSNWEHRLHMASNAWVEAEERSVEEGYRDFALVTIDDRAFVEKSLHYAKKGLHVVPLTLQNKSSSYSSSSKVYDPSKPHNIRAVITKHPALIPDWVKAWEAQDNQAIGRFLGFPECCIKFFEETWVKQHYLDTTWPMYQNSTDTLAKSCRPLTNILLRWVGIRLVSHLPCSFDCEATVEKAEDNLDLLQTLGFEDQYDDIFNLLSMPVEWSAKHGIAEIKTPLFKVSTGTDATSELYVVQRDGEFYPHDAPSGNKFPYRNTQKNLVSLSKSFKKSLDAVDSSLEWKDNGFSSKEAMEENHAKLISSLDDAEFGFYHSHIVDFGCGNGLLLRKLDEKYKGMMMIGVEKEFEIAKRAQLNNPSFVIHNRDIWDSKEPLRGLHQMAYGIISVNRLLEYGQTKSVLSGLQYIMSIVRKVFVYSYDSSIFEHFIADLTEDVFDWEKHNFGYLITWK